MPWWLTLLVVIVGVVVVDRVLLWFEVRGWIFYRKRKPTGGGSAALGVAAELFQPSQHSAVQELQEQSRRMEDVGDADPLDRRKTALESPDTDSKTHP
ncbi:hypothetical protein EDF62_1632 [Leucobacter luti]|uniref:Uncharacterized protein n=1 Tax=Leucobacter luti TaxID=340320 RepID=A0A4R6S1C1_9MICO|nr:hypothetical protein EDF62_1632 [Leucobacter luti]